jgi:hypothetical protein
LARKKTANPAGGTSGATIGYEAQLWQMADAFRANTDAATAAGLEELGYGG